MLSIIDYCLQIGNSGIVYLPATRFLKASQTSAKFQYLIIATPRSLSYSKHMNTSSLAIACGDRPAHRCYDHVRVVARTVSRMDGWTDGKSMDLPTPSPKHIIPNHPFYFFAFGKKVVDGKNQSIAPKSLIYHNTCMYKTCTP